MTISGSANLTQKGHDLDANIDYGVAKGLDAAISNAIAKAKPICLWSLVKTSG